jgi:hypothetical protein
MKFSSEELASAFGVPVNVAEAIMSDLNQPLSPLGLLERAAETLFDNGATDVYVDGIAEDGGAIWIERDDHYTVTIAFNDNDFELTTILQDKLAATQGDDDDAGSPA